VTGEARNQFFEQLAILAQLVVKQWLIKSKLAQIRSYRNRIIRPGARQELLILLWRYPELDHSGFWHFRMPITLSVLH